MRVNAPSLCGRLAVRQINKATGDYRTAPIRTYAEVAAEMRRRGCAKMTAKQVWWYEQSAFKKLRPLLRGLAGEIE